MVCDQCGKPLTFARKGGMRKRFCSHECRNRFHNGRARDRKATGATVAQVGSVSHAQLVADLEWLYGLLAADVRRLGVKLADGRLNPSAAELRRVSVELARMAPAPEEEEEADGLLSVLVGYSAGEEGCVDAAH